MRWINVAIITLFVFFPVVAQPDLQKLVDTEHSFAQMAADKGTKPAFLANMTDDAVVFNPDKANAKTVWMARGESQSLLSWAPNYADISSSGILGYTTGNWEFRQKGKGDTPTAFGDFITVWLRQPDGKYKWVIDIGVGHAKPDKYSTEWATSNVATSEQKTKATAAFETAAEFYQLADSKGLAKAYETFAADDIRAYREDKLPILGRKGFVKMIKGDKAVFTFTKRSSTFGSEDLSYSLNTYTKMVDDKVVEKGNFLQIWKFYGGKWHIVLDVFKPVTS